MSNGKEQIQVEFHNRANALFISVYHAFENAVASLSRRHEEFKFQQLKKKHAEILQEELQIIAKDLLQKHRDETGVNDSSQLLHGFIFNYLHRFIQKINDL